MRLEQRVKAVDGVVPCIDRETQGSSKHSWFEGMKDQTFQCTNQVSMLIFWTRILTVTWGYRSRGGIWMQRNERQENGPQVLSGPPAERGGGEKAKKTEVTWKGKLREQGLSKPSWVLQAGGGIQIRGVMLRDFTRWKLKHAHLSQQNGVPGVTDSGGQMRKKKSY